MAHTVELVFTHSPGTNTNQLLGSGRYSNSSGLGTFWDSLVSSLKTEKCLMKLIMDALSFAFLILMVIEIRVCAQRTHLSSSAKEAFWSTGLESGGLGSVFAV